MSSICLRTASILLGLFSATVAIAQSITPTASDVPKLVRFSGSFHPADGGPAQPMESVTLSVYRDQTGGDALWHEIQNVVVDSDGRYSALMGSTQNQGMPLDLFASGEPRWLGAQFNRPGESEHPRVLLVSVPYALKAVDAETLGGKPASAYLLAGPTVDAASSSGTTARSATPVVAVKPKALPQNSGMPNFIGKFVDTTDLVDSAIYEVNGNVGIGTATPAIALDARTGPLPQMGVAGVTDYLAFFASDMFGPAIYWDPAKDMRFGTGGSALYNPYGFVERMRIRSGTGNVGIGTNSPRAKLDVTGSINFTQTLQFQDVDVLKSSPPETKGLKPIPSGGNLAVGLEAFVSGLGSSNTAIGTFALSLNNGAENTATGFGAMPENTSGSFNTAFGANSMEANTIGSSNTALGANALPSNTTGSNNIALGVLAGESLGATTSFNIDIGNVGNPSDSGTIRIGDPMNNTAFFAAGVVGVTTINNDAVPVMIDSAGQLGTVSSSRRFKEDIQDMGAASVDLMRLRPVTYRYKQAFDDGNKPIQYGLIAEEVAEIYPGLVAHSADGQIQTVKYQVLDSMLLNEVQRQQAEIGDQKSQIRMLEQRLARLETVLAPK